MEILIIVIFILGYLAIAFEHPLKIDKAAPALLLGVLTWAVYALMYDGHGDHHVLHELEHHLPEIMNILFFLLGAMTIVELIDIHDGFAVITSRINTASKVKMLWILCILTFFMSATLDNLTTAIVMASLIGKLIKDGKERLLYAGMIVIAANAGGAWSPIGDVTTTMLWIGGCLSVSKMIPHLIIPSLVCMFAPLIVMSFRKDLQGNFDNIENVVEFKTTPFERNLMLACGVGGLVFVPVFKTATHLPPFMGMMLSLGFLWLVAELLHKNKNSDDKRYFSPFHALAKIDAASILFFFGILVGVGCLASIGTLQKLAVWLNDTIGNMEVITMVIGILSAIVDNVPLVAASMKMYEVAPPGSEEALYFAIDGKFWEFLAYCAGTGGSMLIIGSAAGVAIMGIEKIEFFWYMKNFSILALIGYFAGAFTYLLMFGLF